MSLKHRAGVLAILLVVLPGIAWGDDDEGFSHSGFYVGVGGSYVTDTFESDVNDAFPGVSVDIEESWGINAVVGYRILPFLAAEFEYEYIDEFDINVLGVKAATLELARNTAMPAWSSGWPQWPAGVRASTFSCRPSICARAPRVSSVSIQPGSTALTWMLSLAQAVASALVSCTMPPLLAA